MLYKRQIINNLIEWKESTKRKPLILRGARQVGKTSLVHYFSKQYEQYIYLNLELDAAIFENINGIDNIIEAIFFLHKKELRKLSETLLFIDEIQEVPKVINLLRYFYEKYPKLHVIAAGSLLETLLNDDTQYPVGRVEFLAVHPFSFTEYLMAMDENELSIILGDIHKKAFTTDILFEHFHKYALLGGMPEIVKEYKEYKSLNTLSKVYDNLLYAYMNDISKYARNSTIDKILRHCLQQIFFHGGKRVAYTNFGNSNYKAREVGDAMNTLQRAMLLELVFPFTNYDIPISINFRKRPKLILLDTGLMNHFVGLIGELIGTKDISEIYAGHLIEQIVGQEIKSNFTSPLQKNLFWVNEKSNSDAEVDFAIQHRNHVIPIEVKSGKIGKLKSLLQFMENSKGKYAVRLYKGDLLVHKVKTVSGHVFVLINLPYFLAGYINQYIDKVIDHTILVEDSN